MLVKSMVVLLALGGAVVVEAAGIPASSCTYRSLNHLTGFDCNLYPSTAGAFNGNVSFTFASLLPGFDPTFEALTTGFIVMDNTPAAVLADGSQADLDRSHWTQILQFKDSGGLSNQGLAAESITLFTGGGYPATATVTDVNSFALYFAEPALHNFWPGTVVQVPAISNPACCKKPGKPLNFEQTPLYSLRTSITA